MRIEFRGVVPYIGLYIQRGMSSASVPPCFTKIEKIKNPGDLKEGVDYLFQVVGEPVKELQVYMADPDMEDPDMENPYYKEEPESFGQERYAAYLSASIDYDDEEGNQLLIKQIWVPTDCRGRKFASFFLWRLAKYVADEGIEIGDVQLNDVSNTSLYSKSNRTCMLTKKEMEDVIREYGGSIYSKFGFKNQFIEDEGKQSTTKMTATFDEFKGAVDAQWRSQSGGRRRRRRTARKTRRRSRGRRSASKKAKK